jgi:hypothetical protein
MSVAVADACEVKPRLDEPKKGSNSTGIDHVVDLFNGFPKPHDIIPDSGNGNVCRNVAKPSTFPTAEVAH